jgi:hypothetical protein
LRYLDGFAILPMICVVALLITPGPYHRIVQNGEDSRSFHGLVTTIANLALVPFAIALGLDVVVTFGHLFGEVSGVVAGTAAGGVAIGFWYGVPLAKRRHNCEQESAMTTRLAEKSSATAFDVKIEQMLTEARVILPGAQALFGFQLAIVFTRSFSDLPAVSMIVHAASLLLVTLTVVLLMAPAAYHRLVNAGEASADMYRVGSARIDRRYVCGDEQNHHIARRCDCRRRRDLYFTDRALARLPDGYSCQAHAPRSGEPVGRVGVADWSSHQPRKPDGQCVKPH